jgi:hypothetical protein
MDEVHKPTDSECYTPPLEPFRFYHELTSSTIQSNPTNEITHLFLTDATD